MDIEELLLAFVYGACVGWQFRRHLYSSMYRKHKEAEQWGKVTDYMFWYRSHFEVRYV